MCYNNSLQNIQFASMLFVRYMEELLPVNKN